MRKKANRPPPTSAPAIQEDLPPSEPAKQKKLAYEPNPKHKEPWQRGRKGSLCPKNLVIGETLRLLREESVLHGQARYAIHCGRAFKAIANHQGIWHGWPVGWVEVPESLRLKWRNEDKLKKRDMTRYWLSEDLPEKL